MKTIQEILKSKGMKLVKWMVFLFRKMTVNFRAKGLYPNGLGHFSEVERDSDLKQKMKI